ncbi:olfactory receptor 1361-like [Puma concolor]|uniref:Olfactory receptor 1361-like n=1 Tax=Puma concolor TaxID=9696 RepID=A0A6P6H361_PUMCO|nr:olfactory receptor 1361-like [Puma concolor]
MSRGNQSHITEFLLLGLTSDPKHQEWLFASFLAMYLVNVAGNSVIIAAIWGDTRLHTPMYFFLSNLSLVDICFTNVIVPRMLANMLNKTKKISFAQCLTQMYFFVTCAITDSFLLAFTEGSLVIMSPFILIIVSYVHITRAVLRVPSRGGRHKVFSTCGSHLTVVALFYGTAISVYIRPSSTYSVTKDSVVTVIYTVVIPMLNPFIYSLRNKDMKQALRKLTRRKE